MLKQAESGRPRSHRAFYSTLTRGKLATRHRLS